MLNPYRFDPKFKFFYNRVYVSIKNVKMYWFSYQVFFIAVWQLPVDIRELNNKQRSTIVL